QPRRRAARNIQTIGHETRVERLSLSKGATNPHDPLQPGPPRHFRRRLAVWIPAHDRRRAAWASARLTTEVVPGTFERGVEAERLGPFRVVRVEHRGQAAARPRRARAKPRNFRETTATW